MGLLGMVAVTVVVTASEPATDLDRALASLSPLLLYVPLAAWGVARGGRRRLCVRHRMSKEGRLRCTGDHGVERRWALLAAGVLSVVVIVGVWRGAWEEASVFAMLPVGLFVLASGYRSSSTWRLDAGAESNRRRLR